MQAYLFSFHQLWVNNFSVEEIGPPRVWCQHPQHKKHLELIVEGNPEQRESQHHPEQGESSQSQPKPGARRLPHLNKGKVVQGHDYKQTKTSKAMSQV